MTGRFAIAALIGLAGVAAVALAAGSGERATPPASGTATDGWASLKPSPLRRTEVGGARIGDRIYVVGGFVPEGGATRRMVRYDIGSNSWKELRRMPIAVHHPGVAAYRGKLYVHGGLRTDGPVKAATSRLYRYDPARNRWRRLRGSRVPRLAQGFEVIGNRIYAAGGNNEISGDQSVVEAYNPRRNRWRRMKPMPTARHHVGAAALGGELYVVAGRADGENIDVVERFDPEAGRRGRWQSLAPVETERSGFAAVASKGSVIAFGGEELGGGETIAPVERYAPETDSWSALPAMSTPRHGIAGVARRGRVYAIEGGRQPGLSYASTNEFLDLP